MIGFQAEGSSDSVYDDREGRTAISATIHRSTISTPARSRRPGGIRSTPASRPHPSVRRAADRRAHLLEQEVTLAYLRELAGPDALPGRRPG